MKRLIIIRYALKEDAVDWKFIFPQNSSVAILTAKVRALGGEDFEMIR